MPLDYWIASTAASASPLRQDNKWLNFSEVGIFWSLWTKLLNKLIKFFYSEYFNSNFGNFRFTSILKVFEAQGMTVLDRLPWPIMVRIYNTQWNLIRSCFLCKSHCLSTKSVAALALQESCSLGWGTSVITNNYFYQGYLMAVGTAMIKMQIF